MGGYLTVALTAIIIYVTMPSDNDTDGQKWVTIEQAIVQLGKSERTIRRWVAAGRLPVDKSVIPHKVDIATELAGQEGITSSDSGRPSGAGSDVDRFQAEIDRLSDRLDNAIAETLRLQADKDKLEEKLEADKTFLQNALAEALVNQRKLIEAGQPRRWRWPWQRED